MNDIDKLNRLVNIWRIKAEKHLEAARCKAGQIATIEDITRRATYRENAYELESVIGSLEMYKYLHINDANLLIQDMASRTRFACAKAVLQVDKSGAPEKILNRAYKACMQAMASHSTETAPCSDISPPYWVKS